MTPTLRERLSSLATIKTFSLFVCVLVVCSLILLLSEHIALFATLISNHQWNIIPDILYATFLDFLIGKTAIAQSFLFVGLLLLAFNITLLIWYIVQVRNVFSIGKHAGMSLLGTVGLMIGLQCLSCVTVVGLFSISLISGSTLIHLPFAGSELVFFGLGVLFLSTFFLFKKVTNNFIC